MPFASLKADMHVSYFMPYDKRGYAKRSKDPRHYRVKDEFGRIIAYGHTPEEAVAKAKKKRAKNDPFDFSSLFS
jgi:hypothetical protein